MISLRDENTLARARQTLLRVSAPSVGGGLAARLARGLAYIDPRLAPGTGEYVPAVGELERLKNLRTELVGEDGSGGILGELVRRAGPPSGGA